MSQFLDTSDFPDEESTKGFDYPIPGQYHAVVNNVDEAPTGFDGMKVEFIMLAGTGEHQINKRFEEAFFWPRSDAKDGGKFARKRLARLALATGLITPAQLGTQVEIDWEAMKYRQLKLSVTHYERTKDGKTYKGAQVEGLEMYGPLDPTMAHVPCDPEAIAMARDAGQCNVQLPVSQQKPSANGAANPVKPAATKPTTGTGGAAPKTPPAQQQKPASPPAPAAGSDPYAGL